MDYYVIENCIPNSYICVKNKHNKLNNILKSVNKKICFIRNPINRLIEHYHSFDFSSYKCENLMDLKKKNNNLFECYVKNLGNLQTIKLCDLVDESYFLKNSANDKIFNNSMDNISKFDMLMFYEDYEKNENIYKYPDYFIEILIELCFYDITLYNDICKKYKKYNFII